MLQCAEEYLPTTFAHCFRYDAERLQDPSKCLLNATLEDRRTPPFRIGFAACFTVLLVLFVTCRNRPKRLKSWIFWLLPPTIALMQCLTSFSAGQYLSAYLWSWSSPFRGLWILSFIDNPCWNLTYLGFHDDFYSHVASHTIRNADGDPTHVVFRLYDREKRVAIRSASTDLLTLNTPHHAFHGSMSHCFTIVVIVLGVMFEIRTPDKSNHYLIGIPLRLISIAFAFVLIANEAGLLECDGQRQRYPRINARYENLSDEVRWELWNYARIRL